MSRVCWARTSVFTCMRSLRENTGDMYIFIHTQSYKITDTFLFQLPGPVYTSRDFTCKRSAIGTNSRTAQARSRSSIAQMFGRLPLIIRPSIATLCPKRPVSPVTKSFFSCKITAAPIIGSRTMATTNGGSAMEQRAVAKEAQHLANGKVAVNNWAQPGPAAFDFRSE